MTHPVRDDEPGRPVHDPVLAKEAGRWHLFCTGDTLRHRTSTDLRRWSDATPPLASIPDWGRTAIPGVRNVWAPDILRAEGAYRLYYSLSTFGSQRSAIGLAEANSLDGPWVDRGAVMRSVPGDPFNAIDPNVIDTHREGMWMAFGSFWRGIHLIQLDRASGLPKSGAEPIRIAARPEGDAIEAAFLLEHAGWIWCFASTDYCCRGTRSTYKTIVGRARSVRGPYLDREGVPLVDGGGTVLLRSGPRWRGPGHPGFARDGRHWRIALHAYDAGADGVPTLRTALLRWRDGWPEVPDLIDPVGPTDGAAGIWEHRVGHGPANQITLESDGRIETGEPRNEPRGAVSGSWSVVDSALRLRWTGGPNVQSVEIETVRLRDGNRTYLGTDTKGRVISGVRVE